MPQTAAASRRQLFLLLMAVLILGAALLASAAWWRPIDGDEGYYAAAARLTAEGNTPYTDYFYPQAPLLPYVYAPVVEVFGPSLRALRWLSASLALMSLGVWAWHLACRDKERPWLAAASLALVALNPDVISWGVTVKTYGLTGLLAAVALVTLRRGLEPGARPFWLLAAGLALGLAGSVRLFFAPLGPLLVMGLLILRPGGRPLRSSVREVTVVAAGLLIGMLPLLVAWLRGPDLFMFDNLGYHELRFSELRDMHPNPHLGVRLGYAVRDTLRIVVVNPFLLGLLVLAGFGVVKAWRRGVEAGVEGRWLRLVSLLAAFFLLACMAPDPVHAQYFTAPLAIMVLPLAMTGLAHLVRRRRSWARIALASTAVICGLVLTLLKPGMDLDHTWTFASYDRVVADIEARSDPGDMVLAFWPGYVFGSGREFFPGLENHFAVGVSEKLTPREKTRYRIAGRHQMASAFSVRQPRLVVIGGWMHEINTALDDDQMDDLLESFQTHYRVVVMRGPVKICAPVGR